MTEPVDAWAVIEAVFRQDAAPEPPRPAVAYLTPTAGTGYATAALEAEVQRVVDAPEGTRNHTLNRAAFSLGQLVAGGVLDEADVVSSLSHAARQAGLEGVEITRTIQSGMAGGAATPRGVPDKPDVDGWVASLRPAVPAEVQYDPQTGEVIEPQVQRTSWWPRDLGPILAGTAEPEPPPAFLARQDGHRLFYAGKINGLIGESESGKTWVALLAVQQALAVGEHVAYLDFEDTAPGVVARLRLLGCTDAHLSRLSYIGPDDAFDAPANRDLSEHLQQHRPSLVVLDGYNAAMTMLGLNLLDNMDIYRFALTILRPIKNTGAAVVTIDHVTKSKEGRGSFAIGGQAKRSDVDGCALSVEVVQPFGKGMRGKLKLTVSKDRPGEVRAVSASAKFAGHVHLDSSEDSVRMWIEEPDLRPMNERGPFRPTGLMEKASRYLESVEGGASGAAVEKELGGKREWVRDALDRLVEEGFARRSAGPRGAVIHHFVDAFRDDQGLSGPTSPDLARPRPDLAPGRGPNPERPRPSPPLSTGGEEARSGGRPPARSEGDDLAPDDDDPAEDWWKR